MTRSLAGFLLDFSPRDLLIRGLDAMLAWQDRAEEAHRVRAMDDRQLKDIGLTRSDIERILRQPRHL